jgi:hypothetical protein
VVFEIYYKQCSTDDGWKHIIVIENKAKELDKLTVEIKDVID